jgi:hypothetical protein
MLFCSPHTFTDGAIVPMPLGHFSRRNGLWRNYLMAPMVELLCINTIRWYDGLRDGGNYAKAKNP